MEAVEQWIDQNQVQCENCQHFFIDVTAAQRGGEYRCLTETEGEEEAVCAQCLQYDNKVMDDQGWQRAGEAEERCAALEAHRQLLRKDCKDALDVLKTVRRFYWGSEIPTLREREIIELVESTIGQLEASA